MDILAAKSTPSLLYRNIVYNQDLEVTGAYNFGRSFLFFFSRLVCDFQVFCSLHLESKVFREIIISICCFSV